MEGVQVLVFAWDLWDEFYISSRQFSSNLLNENGRRCIEQSNTVNQRNFRSEQELTKINDNIIYPIKRNKEEILIGDPCFPSDSEVCNKCKKERPCFKQCYKTKMTGYFLSVFVHTLKSSEFYRTAVITHLLHCKKVEQNKHSCDYSLKLIIQLCSSQKDIIDYNWNERMGTMALERRELDHAMAWFSTLGGAFSALGDHFDHCAVVAGRISLKQLKLALRLGDPLTVARCKLYLALSLIQRGYVKRAKIIIKEQYNLALASPVVDTRLVRMCQGIWAKLKYTHKLRKCIMGGC